MADTPSSDASNEAFFREVDDAVRQDQLLGFWERFGKWLVGVVVLGLVALGGWLYWEHHERETSAAIAEKAIDVVDAASQGGKPDDAEMKALADADQIGYRAMARLTQAGMAAKEGDSKKAAGLYGQLAADSAMPQPYRDLATIRQVALTFDQMKPQQVVDRLKPLAVEGGPWFGSAGEMTAIAYMKMGKKNLAGPIFAAIAKDDKAPQTVRVRARQMAGLLGVDAVDEAGMIGAEVQSGESEGGNAVSN